ncbi:GTP 3',8-cyclase MoaA [Candidatus Margulisiibacteriota bacterium]
MLKDRYNRQINYLRVSVTDKCNLRCNYCMPEEGLKLKKHEDILSLEELFDVVQYAVSIGFSKIRLTGGEPLVRKNIVFLVESIGQLPGLKDFGLTTNGILLPEFAPQLKKAGLNRVNISLDSLDKAKYKQITRGGDLDMVLAGIKAAQKEGLSPLKLNVVNIPGFNDNEKENFLRFGKENGLEVRFIHQMDLKEGQRNGVEGDTTVGQCTCCNRLRLTCDGNLKPCLFSADNINIRELGVEKAFKQALETKPEYGVKNEAEHMYQIGG